MQRNSVIPWWGWAMWILAIALGFAAYMYLPAQVIGEAHRRLPRLLVVMYEPALMLGVILFWHVIWRFISKRKDGGSDWPTYRYIGGVIIVCMALIYLVVLCHELHIPTISIRLAPTVYGIVFILIANVLPRIQPNWWIGVRTPWTLASKENWTRTHRLAGQLGIPMGILIVILAWVLPTNRFIWLSIVVLLILWVIVTVSASYFYAKKLHNVNK